MPEALISSADPSAAALCAADQAHGLRRLFRKHDARLLPIVADANVRDGQALALDVAMRWAQDGWHVLVLDGTRQDVASHTADRDGGDMLDLMQGDRDCEDVVEQVSNGVWLLPAALGLQALVQQGLAARALFEAAASLPMGVDRVIVLAPAPTVAALFAGEATIPLVLAADDAHGLTEAYLAVKTLATEGGLSRSGLVMTDRGAPARARSAAQRIAQCARRFLRCDAHLAAIVPTHGADIEAALDTLAHRALEHALCRDAGDNSVSGMPWDDAPMPYLPTAAERH